MKKPEILIIDDDANLRRTLSDILKVNGYEPHAVPKGAEALALVRQYAFAVALIDLNLPDMTGMDVLKGIKTESPSTQAIILTGNATLDTAIEATNKGVFSYLQKPYDMEQLLLNIMRAVGKWEAEAKINRDGEELQEMNAQLKALYEISLAVSRNMEIDALFQETLEALATIELFKADILRKAIRGADQIFRYGGEEFLILLSNADPRSAQVAAERLRKAIASDGRVTISLGISSYGQSTGSSEDLIAKADEALYRAKGNGRNKAEVYGANDSGPGAVNAA